MAPITLVGVVVLILLVVPGLHYELLRRAYRLDSDDSAFIEASRVLLSGVILSGITFVILGVARLIGPGVVLDLRELLTEPTYFSGHLIPIMRSTAVFLVLSLTLGAYAAHKWPRAASIRADVGSSGWTKAFADTPQSIATHQHVPVPDIQVQITLKDGRVYKGLLADYSKNTLLADRELVLKEPLSTVNAEGRDVPPGDQNWHQLILPAVEVASIHVRYHASAKGQPATPGIPGTRERSWRRRVINKLASLITWCYQSRNNTIFLGLLLIGEIAILYLWALFA